MSGFAFQFDNQSLREVAAMAGVGIFLTDEVGTAMAEGAQLLATGMQDNMHWVGGDGTLSDSIVPLVNSPYEVQAGSNDPKAARRNWGFTGMTDSFGAFLFL